MSPRESHGAGGNIRTSKLSTGSLGAAEAPNPIFCWLPKKNRNFLEKSTCRFGSVSVNSPSPAAQRCTNGAPDGPADHSKGYETQTTTEIDEAGRAGKVRAHSVDFVSDAL